MSHLFDRRPRGSSIAAKGTPYTSVSTSMGVNGQSGVIVRVDRRGAPSREKQALAWRRDVIRVGGATDRRDGV